MSLINLTDALGRRISIGGDLLSKDDGIVIAPEANYIVQDIEIGDSFTGGHNNTSHQAPPNQLAVLNNADSFYVANATTFPNGWLIQNDNSSLVVNHGISSQRVDQMIAAFNSQVLSRTGNAVTTRVGLLGGINDLAAGATESDLINRWKSYAALCAANNLPLRISTLLPANAAGAAYQPRIANLNGWLRRNWQTLADTFVDFWENPNLTNADNSTYFEADGHQTPEGSVEMAAAVDAAMKKNVFIDRFKRTNGAAGNGWDYRTATGSFYGDADVSLLSNALHGNCAAKFRCIFRPEIRADSTQRVTVTATDNTGGIVLIARKSEDNNTAYFCNFTYGVAHGLFKCVGGNFTQLIPSVFRAVVVGDTLELQVIGSNLAIRHYNTNGDMNDESLITDTEIMTGTTGIGFSGTVAAVDNYAIF